MFYHFKIWRLLGQIISQSLNNLTQHRRWHFKKERFYFLFTNIQPINFLKLQIYELSKKINFLFYKCKCLLACMYVHCVCVQCPQRPEEDIWAVVSFHVGARNWTWILSNTPNLWTIFPGSVFFVCLSLLLFFGDAENRTHGLCIPDKQSTTKLYPQSFLL